VAYKILQSILTGTLFCALSSTPYAMGACPEACTNQMTIESCEQYQCYKEDNSCVKCQWKERVGSRLPHCIPSQNACETTPDSQ
jgi:hypothetical protein